MTRRSRSKQSKTRRLRRLRRSLYSGGGFSTGPAFVSAGNLEIRPVQGEGPDCLAASRPGMIPSRDMGGLPGMRGGRYGMSMEASVLDASRGIVGPIAQAVRIPCESGAPNALNLRGGASSAVPSAVPSAVSTLEVGKAADMAVYHAPTAGYGNRMEAVGGQTPLMLQIPYAAKSCLSGGSRRNRKRSKKAKRSKKTKKAKKTTKARK